MEWVDSVERKHWVGRVAELEDLLDEKNEKINDLLEELKKDKMHIKCLKKMLKVAFACVVFLGILVVFSGVPNESNSMYLAP